MTDLEPCLVVNASGEWRIEERPPVPPRIPLEPAWSSQPTPGYYLTSSTRETKLRLRRKAKFMEAAE